MNKILARLVIVSLLAAPSAFGVVYVGFNNPANQTTRYIPPGAPCQISGWTYEYTNAYGTIESVTVFNGACRLGQATLDNPNNFSTWSYTWDPVTYGTNVLSAVASSARGSATGTVTVVFVSTNNPPVASNQTISVMRNIPTDTFNLMYSHVEAEQTLSFTVTTPPNHGSLSQPYGTNYAYVIYTPTTSYTGPDSFCWKASDGYDNSAAGTCTVQVSAWNVIAVVVNTNLHPLIEPQFSRYTNDLAADGYIPVVKDWNLAVAGQNTPANLRDYLKTVPDLGGAVFIGDLPVASFYNPNEYGYKYPAATFPFDLYFMDLQVSWADTNGDSVIDLPYGSGISPKIWVSRILCSGMSVFSGCSEATLVKRHLDKNHAYRIGDLRLPDRGLLWALHDWNSYTPSDTIGPAYTNSTRVTDLVPGVTIDLTDWSSRWRTAYETEFFMCHSSSWFHQIPGGDVNCNGLATADICRLFWNCWNCSGARYTDGNYAAGVRLFTPKYGLISIGSSKTGSMLSANDFYTRLNAQKSHGTAFKEWFANNYSDVSWHYGMVLLGDGTLKLGRYQQPQVIPNTAPTLSSVTNITSIPTVSVGPIPVTVGDAESSVSNLLLWVETSNRSLIPACNFTFGGSGSNRTMSLTPVPNMIGVATVNVTVCDGILMTSNSFVYSTANQAPVASNDIATVEAGHAVSINVLTNDFDPDSPEKVMLDAVVTQPTHGTAEVSGSQVIYTSTNTSWSGVDTFTYRIRDQFGATAMATVSVTVVIPCTLTVATSGTGAGSVSLSPTGFAYLTGTVVTVTAIPATNSVFSGWSGALSGTTNPASLLMTTDTTVTATFTLMAPPVITSPLAVTGVVGEAFSYVITALNAPMRFTATGLPDGLSLDAVSGIITGVSAIAVTTNIMIGATNVYGADTRTLMLNVNYAINATAGSGGSIAPTGRVMLSGGVDQAFSIAPLPWHAIANVAVDGVSIGAVTSHTFVNVMTNHTITAAFTALLAPLGTPEWWLAQYGWTSDFAAAELADSDGDGIPTCLEYLAGTNPTNPLSRQAFNVVPYAESFENLAGWGGGYGRIQGYKGWHSNLAANDQSRITNLLYSLSVSNQPLPYMTHTNVLWLDTQGGMLTNSFGAGFDMSGVMTYVDMATQFVPSPDPPPTCAPTDTGLKAAIYANASSNLAVYHGVAAANGTLLSNTVTATSVALNPANWYRITLAVDATATNNATVAMFQVKVNGVIVTNTTGYTDDWKAQFNSTGLLPAPSANGVWFRTATANGNAKKLMALSCGGTGYVDDLVVTTRDPFNVLPSFMLIVARTGKGCSSLGPASVVSVPVAAGSTTQITYTADDWYRIGSLTSNGAAVTAAQGARNFTQAIVSIAADVSNSVTFTQTTAAQTGFTNVPTSWLTNWNEGAVGSHGDGLDVTTKYLLGLDPTVSNTFLLTVDGFNVSGSNVVTTVRRTVTGALSPDGMHGYLKLQATDNLGGSFTNISGTEVTGSTVFDGTGRRVYTNSVDGIRRFYRSIIE